MAATPKKPENNLQPKAVSGSSQPQDRGHNNGTTPGVVWLIGMAIGWLALAAIPVEGQPSAPNRSLKPTDQEKTPAVASAVGLDQLTRAQLQQRVRDLADSLARANVEARDYRKKYEELRERDEALGISLLTDSERLLRRQTREALKEAVWLEKRRRKLREAVQDLLQAGSAALASADEVDPAKRADYEVASRQAKQVLEGRGRDPVPIPSMLTDGLIIDVAPERGAVAINLGTRQGLREGAPMLVKRGTQTIGLIKVVVVYDLASSALIEQTRETFQIQPGDRVTPKTN